MKLDCYMGVRSDAVWGINRYKQEVFSNLEGFDKKKIVYSIPSFAGRLFNFFDFLTLSPLAVSKKQRKGAGAFILSHSEAYLLNFFKFRKSVVLCYDILPFQFKLSGWMSRAKLNFAFKGMLKADRIIAVSEAVKDDIVNYMNYPAERIDVIYGGVDPNHYKPLKGDFSDIKRKYGVPENKKVILFLSSEEPRKNFHILLRAVAILKRQMPDVVLLKVGNAQKQGIRDKNLRLAKRLGISRDVIFTGFISEEDTPKVYNLADVFAFPTLYEGAISLPLIEAMACGCPVISTKYVTETIGDNSAMLKNATDPWELAELMFKVLSDKSFSSKVSKHGLIESERFHWEKTGKSTSDILKKVFS